MLIEGFFEGLIEGCVVPVIEVAFAGIFSTMHFGSQITSTNIPLSETITFLIFNLVFAIITSSMVTYWQYYRNAYENPLYSFGYLLGVIALVWSAISLKDIQMSLYFVGIIIVIVLGLITKIFVYTRFEN
ncbi:MAG: hypothetical protein ACLQMU_01635 [Methanoregula sp.]|uniref:hypothetical protein n=1 Tax=Methanoregula sp. TaxID=2052170 RepID=UPI003C4DE0D9